MRRSGLTGLEARLARGYAIVRRTETGELVRSGDALAVRVEDGQET